MWFIGVEVEQEKSASPPKKNPGSASVTYIREYQSQESSAVFAHYQAIWDETSTQTK